MKAKFVIIVLLFFKFQNLFAQHHDFERDHIWLLGNGFISETDQWQDSITSFNFNENPVKIDFEDHSHNMRFGDSNAMLCTPEGELLCYSNGCRVYNKNHEILVNGDQMLPNDWMNTEYCPRFYPFKNNFLMLPDPEEANVVHLFTVGLPTTEISLLYGFGLYQSIIDMNRQGGQGEVIQKNKLILSDSLFYGQLTATRHANGRDWWIINSKAYSNVYYKTLLSKDTTIGPLSQEIGLPNIFSGSTGQAVFSPDGTRYVRYDPYMDLQIFDFDRCEGLLSNFRPIPIQDHSDTTGAGGVAFSPNARFLYVPSGRHCYQFDTHATDIAESRKTIGVWDGFKHKIWPTYFHNAMLAPDGKIYMSCLSSNAYMHIIHHPNREGLSCNFEPRTIFMPTWSDGALPNYPYLRLGALKGSLCDTLDQSQNSSAIEANIKLYPNPVNGYLNLEVNHYPEDLEFKVFNALGQLVESSYIPCCIHTETLLLKPLAKGVYFYTLYSEKSSKKLKSGKLIIGR